MFSATTLEKKSETCGECLQLIPLDVSQPFVYRVSENRDSFAVQILKHLTSIELLTVKLH